MRERIFNVLFVSVFAVMLGLGIVAPLMPLYAENLGATGLWLGMIFAGFSLTRAIFTPIVGRLSDRRGRKSFITLGLFLYSTISLLYTVAGDVLTLTGVRLIHGFASAMVIPIAMAYIGETTEKGQEGKAMGTFSMALFLGMGSGPVLGGLMNDSFGIESVFYSMAGLTALAFLTTMLFLPDVKGASTRGKSHEASFREVIRDNLMKGIILFRVVSAMRRGGVMAFLPILASRIGVTPSQVGILLTLVIFLTALLQRTFGKLADRHDRVMLVVIGSVLGALGLICFPFAASFQGLLMYGALVGIGGAVAMPSATALTVQVGQKVGMGTSMGLFNAAMSAGMVLAPMMSGVFMDLMGIESVFYIMGALSLLGTAAFWVLTLNYVGPEGGINGSLSSSERTGRPLP
jgi:MFS family permease